MSAATLMRGAKSMRGVWTTIDRRRRDDRGRDDRGQAVTAIVTVVAIGLILVAVQVLIPFGRSADLAQRAQAAADAAALAAADDVGAQAKAHWTRPFRDRDEVANWLVCGSGGGKAAQYAARNDARVVAYCYSSARDRFEVRVEGRTPLQGQLPRASAVAALGVDWASCRWRSDRTNPRIEHWSCAGLDVPFEIDRSTGMRVAKVPPGWWNNRFVPRLVAR